MFPPINSLEAIFFAQRFKFKKKQNLKIRILLILFVRVYFLVGMNREQKLLPDELSIYLP